MVKYYSELELQSLFSVMEDKEKRILCQMALELGCRVSEICNLPRRRIKHNYIRIFDEKKDQHRDCYISTELADEIENWYWANQSKVKPGPRMFCYYTSKTLNNWLKHYCKLANIPDDKAHFHTFRHTFVVFSFSKGWNLKSICDQTGDSLQTIVNVYGGLSPQDRQEQWAKKPLFQGLL